MKLKEELREIDRKSRKIITISKELHPRSDDRLQVQP